MMMNRHFKNISGRAKRLPGFKKIQGRKIRHAIFLKVPSQMLEDPECLNRTVDFEINRFRKRHTRLLKKTTQTIGEDQDDFIRNIKTIRVDLIGFKSYKPKKYERVERKK